ncbi:MAG: thermonuclease family protein [Anaerolineae bacterium]|nr:thermonuclease family protein [Anaerolineae bacterium]MDW8101359.1 thermonuclease family protein [Anaerolineae bacterium]
MRRNKNLLLLIVGAIGLLGIGFICGFLAGLGVSLLPSGPFPVPVQTPTPSFPPLPPEGFCVPKTAAQEALAVAVLDGDTIDVSLEGKIYRVRYIGIDAPEADEPLFREATQANASMVLNKKLILVRDVSETDRHGRLLRYVFADGVFVNYALVKNGYAKALTYPPDVSCANLFLEAEREAREANLGLWKEATPTPVASACDPSYPEVCIPSPPPDLDCKDIPHRRFKVLPPDPHHFDLDKDGIGCER